MDGGQRLQAPRLAMRNDGDSGSSAHGRVSDAACIRASRSILLCLLPRKPDGGCVATNESCDEVDFAVFAAAQSSLIMALRGDEHIV